METLKFKTNINCGGCIATITPYLDKLENVSKWEVDTESKDKILEITGDHLSREEIVKVVREAGFEIEPAKEGFFRKLF